MRPIEQAILATISYFDVSDYPLTMLEIWQWLYVGLQTADHRLQRTTVEEVWQALKKSEVLRVRLSQQHGLYFLRGREIIVRQRFNRYQIAEDKFERALKVIRWLRFIPFITMIAVCNTLAYNNSRPEADIDLFIVTRRRRVWQVRWWVVGILKLLDLRPRPGKTRDTLCPSFFVDEEHLNLQSIAMARDIYLPYWITQVFPVYDCGVYRKFVQANNSWVREQIPHWLSVMPTSRRQLAPASSISKLLMGLFWMIPEFWLEHYQRKIMPDKLRKAANQDTSIVIQSGMLKFHENDRRQEFWQEWQKRLAYTL